MTVMKITLFNSSLGVSKYKLKHLACLTNDNLKVQTPEHVHVCVNNKMLLSAVVDHRMFTLLTDESTQSVEVVIMARPSV